MSDTYGPILIILLISGCATTDRPVLGDSVTFSPGWSRLKQSSSRALRDPNVWAPLLAAIALQAGDLDEEISDSLREDTPLFGSSQGALDASDNLRSLNEIAYMSTALLVPGPEATDDWLVTKTKLLGMEWLMSEAVGNFTTNIQHYTDREKPNQRNQICFPSFHATTTIFYGRLADLNTDYLPISESSRQALSYSYDGIAGLTSWARVEAGEHYPSDVLVGWALAHYLGYLATDFIAPDQQQLLIRPQLSKDSTGLEFVLRF